MSTPDDGASLDAVKALVDGGADLNARGSAWGGTPLGWAEHYLSQGQGGRPGKQYAEIAVYLRSRGPVTRRRHARVPRS